MLASLYKYTDSFLHWHTAISIDDKSVLHSAIYFPIVLAIVIKKRGPTYSDAIQYCRCGAIIGDFITKYGHD